MAISKKPSSNGADPQVDIEQLINKGGSVANDPTPASSKKNTVVNLHFPPGLIERVDAAVQNRPLKTPRHTWLLEAVLDKLQKEGF